MDKNSVGTQYIICECGDNFPNEDLLNIHLANGHGDVEIFQCDVCPAVFASKPLLHQHTRDHEKQTKAPPPPKLKVYPPKVETPKKDVKKPPIIKLQNLKRIDSISLIQTLKSYAGLVKLEAAPDQTETYPVMMEPTNQVFVKSEVQEPEQEVVNEEIYYQCDVCNTIFYTESDFNVHYQSTHAMKVEPTPEEILEDHLVSDHIDNANVKAEVEAVEAVDTAYYYECEMVKREPGDTVKDTTEVDPLGDVELKKSVDPQNFLEVQMTEGDTNEPCTSKEQPDVNVKKKGAKKEPKKKKPGIDFYANIPEGTPPEEAQKIAEERRKELQREKWRQAGKRYREKYPEKSREAAAKYAKKNPEVRRKASAKYAKNNPEVNRRKAAKYAKSHPEMNRKKAAKYAKSHPEVSIRSSAKYYEKEKMKLEEFKRSLNEKIKGGASGVCQNASTRSNLGIEGKIHQNIDGVCQKSSTQKNLGVEEKIGQMGGTS